MECSIVGMSRRSVVAAGSDVRRPGEIVALTSLRGFLALWVVLYHFWNDILTLFTDMDVFSPFVRFGYMAVPAFFMLSGFVLAYNYSDRFQRLSGAEILRFQAARLMRIYPVHLMTLLTVAVMAWVSSFAGHQLTDTGYSAHDFILNLFLVQTWVPDFSLSWNYPSWSISSEWFAYLLFPLVITISMRHLRTPLRATVFSGISLAAAAAVMTCWATRAYYELVLVVPTFFAGIGAYWLLRGLPGCGESMIWRWLPELLMFAVVASTYTLMHGVVVVSLLSCFFALIAVLAGLGEKCHSLWSFWPAVFLGEISYSLYMSHTLCQKMINVLLPSSKFGELGFSLKIGLLMLYASLTMLWCLSIYHLVERPCRSLFRRKVHGSGGPDQPR